MKTLQLSIFILFSLNLFSQKEKQMGQLLSRFSYSKYYLDDFYWDSTDIKTQKDSFKNKVLKVEYFQLEKDIRLKKTYYNSGSIKSISEVKQKYVIDTIEKINLINLKDSILIKKGFKDIYIGTTEIYYNQTPTQYYWKDTIIDNQKDFWNEGTPKIEYSQLENDKRLRKDYFEDGQLRLTAIVKQKYVIDSFWQINAITLEDELITQPGFIDIIQEIEFTKKPQLRVKGQYLNGIKNGKWLSYLNNEIIQEVEFENGILNGVYTEYYSSNSNKKLQKKRNGEFIEKKILKFPNDNRSNKEYIFSKVKTGTWSTFNKDGSFKHKIVY